LAIPHLAWAQRLLEKTRSDRPFRAVVGYDFLEKEHEICD
jgi:hypothetical protein